MGNKWNDDWWAVVKQQKGAKPMSYDVLSPDGISIWGDSYPSREAAESALREWVRRFEFQGFYSTTRRERIPLDELPGRCRIVEASEDE